MDAFPLFDTPFDVCRVFIRCLAVTPKGGLAGGQRRVGIVFRGGAMSRHCHPVAPGLHPFHQMNARPVRVPSQAGFGRDRPPIFRTIQRLGIAGLFDRIAIERGDLFAQSDARTDSENHQPTRERSAVHQTNLLASRADGDVRHLTRHHLDVWRQRGPRRFTSVS
jgi:hypothetical protein